MPGRNTPSAAPGTPAGRGPAPQPAPAPAAARPAGSARPRQTPAPRPLPAARTGRLPARPAAAPDRAAPAAPAARPLRAARLPRQQTPLRPGRRAGPPPVPRARPAPPRAPPRPTPAPGPISAGPAASHGSGAWASILAIIPPASGIIVTASIFSEQAPGRPRRHAANTRKDQARMPVTMRDQATMSGVLGLAYADPKRQPRECASWLYGSARRDRGSANTSRRQLPAHDRPPQRLGPPHMPPSPPSRPLYRAGPPGPRP